MTAHVLTDYADSVGKAARKPMFSGAAKPLVAKVYEYNMGTDNYTVGGNDISTIWDDFSDVVYIGVEQKDTNTAGDRRDFSVDYSGKTLLVYTAFNTESTATDQGVCTVALFVLGY